MQKFLQFTFCQCHVLEEIVQGTDLEYFFEPCTFFWDNLTFKGYQVEQTNRFLIETFVKFNPALNNPPNQ